MSSDDKIRNNLQKTEPKPVFCKSVVICIIPQVDAKSTSSMFRVLANSIQSWKYFTHFFLSCYPKYQSLLRKRKAFSKSALSFTND